MGLLASYFSRNHGSFLAVPKKRSSSRRLNSIRYCCHADSNLSSFAAMSGLIDSSQSRKYRRVTLKTRVSGDSLRADVSGGPIYVEVARENRTFGLADCNLLTTGVSARHRDVRRTDPLTHSTRRRRSDSFGSTSFFSLQTSEHTAQSDRTQLAHQAVVRRDPGSSRHPAGPGEAACQDDNLRACLLGTFVVDTPGRSLACLPTGHRDAAVGRSHGQGTPCFGCD